MKILIVIGNLNIGGAEHHLLKVMPLLKRRGFDITIYTTNHPGTLAPQMRQAGIAVLAPWGWKFLNVVCKPFVYMASVITLYRYLVKHKPDVVHFYLPGSYLLGGLAALLARHNCLIMSRRIIYSEHYRRSWFFKAEKWLHRHLTHALACSAEIQRELLTEGIAPAQLGIIYNGVEIDKYANLLDQRSARKKLQLPAHAFMMTIIANLYPYKAHKDLFDALALIKEKLPPSWLLLVVGRDGGLRAELEVKSAALLLDKHILFLGERRDTPDILAAADMGISCSHEEGFSNAVLESMAAGLPMVVTDISGNNEAIVHEYNGLIVPKANPAHLAEAILALALNSEKRGAMSLATRDYVKTHFSLEKVIDDYANFYGVVLQ